MRVTINKPSVMDCKDQPMPTAGNVLTCVKPTRYSKKQRTVDMFPFEITNEVTNSVLDKGFISVDTHTGKLTVERRTQDIPFDVERPPESKEKKA